MILDQSVVRMVNISVKKFKVQIIPKVCFTSPQFSSDMFSSSPNWVLLLPVDRRDHGASRALRNINKLHVYSLQVCCVSSETAWRDIAVLGECERRSLAFSSVLERLTRVYAAQLCAHWHLDSLFLLLNEQPEGPPCKTDE